jgi:hypothetical protein
MLIKVGRTAAKVGVNRRIGQWESKCSKGVVLVRKWFCQRHIMAEKMIHLELKLNGFWHGKRFCENCKGYHNDFFRGDLDEIFNRIIFWIEYLNR